MNPTEPGFFQSLVDERRIFPDLAGRSLEEALSEHLDPPRLDEGEEAGEGKPGPLDSPPGDRPVEPAFSGNDLHRQVGKRRRAKDVGGELGHSILIGRSP